MAYMENKGPENSGKNVSPEMQEQFDMFVANGMSIIHDPKVSDDILNRILQSGNPIQAIADSTVDIVTRLSDSAAENNITLFNETLVHGSNMIMGEIMSMAESAGMQKLTEEQRAQSYQLATSKFIDDSVQSGKISQEQLIELGKQVPEQKGLNDQMNNSEPKQQQGQGILNNRGA